MPAVLHRTSEAFEERDSFVRALVGLRVLCERFDAVVAPVAPRASGESGGTEERDTLDDPLLVVLGAVSIRRLLGLRLEALIADAAPDTSRVDARPSDLAGLLR